MQFRRRLAELGAAPLFETWLGSGRAHRVRCTGGHICYSRPNDVQQGGGLCRTCAGSDTEAAEAAFLVRLKELRAAPLYEKWLGTKLPHLVRCQAGHEVSPKPGDILAGQGVCCICTHAGEWDVFYIVASGTAVKFGITTGGPRRRLAAHARQGYTEVVRVAVGLPGAVAFDTERAVRQALALAGEKPIRGREYFGRACLGLIVDVADSWLRQDAPIAA